MSTPQSDCRLIHANGAFRLLLDSTGLDLKGGEGKICTSQASPISAILSYKAFSITAPFMCSAEIVGGLY